jgi:hypothetical protein
MTPLHQIGNALRELMLAVPLPAVRILFVLVPLLLLAWVLFLPGEHTRPPGRKGKAGENLKIWAALALLIQIAIYALC